MNFGYVENLLLQRARFLNNPSGEMIAIYCLQRHVAITPPRKPDVFHADFIPQLPDVGLALSPGNTTRTAQPCEPSSWGLEDR